MTNDNSTEPIKQIKFADPPEMKPRVDGRTLSRKTVSNDKLQGSYLTGNQTITLSGDVSGSGATAITATIANNAINQAKFKYETATVTISNTATSNTATVTSGDIVLGYSISSVSGSPANPGLITISISATTLTVTVGTAPGAGTSITFTVQLLKS